MLPPAAVAASRPRSSGPRPTSQAAPVCALPRSLPSRTRGSPAVSSNGWQRGTKRSRDLLIATLTTVGLTHDPAERRHGEYGTPGWALRTGQPAAISGLIEP